MRATTQVMELRASTGAPDYETWKYFKDLLERLDVGGMSSEEDGAVQVGGVVQSIFKVRFCQWRAPEISNYMRFIDDAADQPGIRGNRGCKKYPRVVSDEQGRSQPPAKLPRLMYDKEWLREKEEKQPGYVEEELLVSEEAFELLVLASERL